LTEVSTERCVLVCGDRDWKNRGPIIHRLTKLDRLTLIIHGDCRGADRIAAQVADELGFFVEPHTADWNKHGKAAGPIRNREMLDLEPKLVIAFHSRLFKSKGTLDCILEANRRRIPVEVIP
jgi:hypothetical protein